MLLATLGNLKKRSVECIKLAKIEKKKEQSAEKVRFSVFSDMCAHWKRSLSNFKREVSLALPKPCQRKSSMFINKCMHIILTHPKSKRQQHLKFSKYSR